MPSSRDLFVGNILFYCFDDDGLDFITQFNHSSLLEIMFTLLIFLTSLSVFYEDSRNAKRILLKPARECTRQSRDWVPNETNMATDFDQAEHVCSKLDLKVTELDFWNSDLSFSSSFTYSSTVGFIND